jgi:hypothetical protein
MAMGTRKRHAKQASMWVATQDLPRTAAHHNARASRLPQRDRGERADQFDADEGHQGGLFVSLDPRTNHRPRLFENLLGAFIVAPTRTRVARRPVVDRRSARD